MKKALMNASVASMIYKFNMDNIRILQSLGYQVDVACNFDPAINPISKDEIEDCRRQLKKLHCRILDTSCPRSVTHVSDMIKSYRQLKKIADREHYDLVHTQSPIGGVICRMAFRQARQKYGTRVIYQAHGFHFFKGAPIWNWLSYYPIEKYCSRMTETLITIAKDAAALAKKKFHCRDVQYVPGVGLDTDKYSYSRLSEGERKHVREEIGVPERAIWILSVGELNENKNHDTVIRAIAALPPETRKKVFYTIAGKGDRKEELEKLASQLHLEDQVKLLGFREDMPTLYAACDIYCIPSIREGLNVSLMEAMASGLRVIASRIRGNVDLVDIEGGELFDPLSDEECASAIQSLIADNNRKAKGTYNRDKVMHFSCGNVAARMQTIYTTRA